MTDKELRKLRRDDLLQILISQQRQIDELTAALEKANAQLQTKRIAISESGSVAEAALRLNGVFEAAQAAADQYQAQMSADADALRAQAEEEARKAKDTAEDVVRTARAEAERILNQARSEAGRVQAEAGRMSAGIEPPEEQPQAEESKPRRGLFGRNRKA